MSTSGQPPNQQLCICHMKKFFEHPGGFLCAPWRWGGRTLAIPFPRLLATPGGSSLNLTSNCLEHVPATGKVGREGQQHGDGMQASLLKPKLPQAHQHGHTCLS